MKKQVFITSLSLILLFALGFTLKRFTSPPPITPKMQIAGIKAYRPDKFFDGYTLIFSKESNCSLIDMKGVLVHTVPADMCLLTEHGSTLLAGETLRLQGSDGDLYWQKSGKVGSALAMDTYNGIYYSLIRNDTLIQGQSAINHAIIGVLEDGRAVFDWNFWGDRNNLKSFLQYITPPPAIGTTMRGPAQTSSINSLHVIPENSSPLSAFKRGNLLISCDFYSSLFILDAQSEKVVWHYKVSEIDGGVHSPSVLANGNILFFFNNRHNKKSELIELNPTTSKVEWKFSSDQLQFYSSRHGSVVRLPNGNTLFSDVYNGGRITEITPEGEIVWQWLSPYEKDMGAPTEILRAERLTKEFVENYFMNRNF